MLKKVGKRLIWILTSGVTLAAGIGALVLSKGAAAGKAAAAGTTATINPQWQVLLPPHHHPPVVPEVNTGLVLLPIALAILLFSSRHLLRRQRLENR